MKKRFCGAVAAFVVLIGCANGDGPTVEPPDTDADLASLFAAPTAAEIAAVEADWSQRNPVAADIRLEREGGITSGTRASNLQVVSHVVDGNRHYGAIVAPQNAPAGTLPVIVYLHGGDQGTDVSEVVLIVSAAGLRIDDYVFVQPAFRSEPLRALGSSWLSGGQPGPWDRDVDDALALLDVALTTTPGADPDRIVLLGQSRGGGVALLMAARDSRIAGVVEFFGPTDFFDSWVREIVEDILRGDNPDLPGLNALASRWILPFAAGDVTLAEMRRQLLLRSPAYFAARLPRTQVHHGSADDVVSVTQTQSLIAAMNALGRGPPDFEAFIYAGGGHNPLTLPASIGRAALFLESVTQEAAAVR